MDDEKRVTHQEWLEHNDSIKALLDDVRDLKKSKLDFEKRLRVVEDSMIKLPQVIQKSISDAVAPLTEENRELNKQVSELRTDKYKTAYDILKWVLISVGGVVVTYLLTVLLNNVFS